MRAAREKYSTELQEGRQMSCPIDSLRLGWYSATAAAAAKTVKLARWKWAMFRYKTAIWLAHFVLVCLCQWHCTLHNCDSNCRKKRKKGMRKTSKGGKNGRENSRNAPVKMTRTSVCVSAAVNGMQILLLYADVCTSQLKASLFYFFFFLFWFGTTFSKWQKEKSSSNRKSPKPSNCNTIYLQNLQNWTSLSQSWF